MPRIAVIGGTGYAGSHIVAEAVRRGHTAVSVARSIPTDRIEGATYIEGTLLDVPGLVAELQGADVVVVAVAPRGDMAGNVRPAIAELATAAAARRRAWESSAAPAAASSRPEGPRLIDTPGFTEEYKPEAFEMIGVLEDLQASGTVHDWFFVHPAGGFGPWNEGERTGEYRDGGDVLVTNEDGESAISGRRPRRGRARRDREPAGTRASASPWGTEHRLRVIQQRGERQFAGADQQPVLAELGDDDARALEDRRHRLRRHGPLQLGRIARCDRGEEAAEDDERRIQHVDGVAERRGQDAALPRQLVGHLGGLRRRGQGARRAWARRRW